MTFYGDIYHNGDWFSRAGVKQSSPEQNFTETTIRRALAAIYGGGGTGPIGQTEPTLADLAPYLGVTSVGGYTKYTNIPWGPCFGVEAWNEPTLPGAPLLQPVVTVYIPPGPVPVGGFPVVMRTHANGSTHEITEGSGSLWTELVVKAMNAKRAVASLEFRHPVPNVSLGAPHLDVGYGVQFVRSLSTALQLNPNIVDCYATSRGNLAVWQAAAPDLADLGSSNFAKRQSSKLRAVWGVNAQDSYSTTEFIQQKVVAADQAAALADPAYADDPRWGSAQQLIRNGTDDPPYLCAVYDAAFVHPLPSAVIGRYTKAQIDANGNLRVHCPEFGKAFLQAYSLRGRSKKLVICDEVTGGVDTTGDVISWFQILDEHPGISAKAARVQAQQRRIGGTVHYLEGNSPVGAYVSQASPTPVTADAEAFGVLVDGAWGSANRLNTVTPLGAAMVQSTSTLRPKLATIPGSGNRAFTFDADDNFRVALTNTTVDVVTYPVGEAPVTGASSRGAAVFTVSSDKIANKTVSMVAAVPNTTFSAQERKFLDQMALELEGREDLITLADAATGLLLPGFTYTRSGPDLWCPQADGSLASFAANVIPREFAGGRWGFRFDPGWSQVARFTHDLSRAAWSRSALLPVVSGALGVNGQADSFALIEDTLTAIHFMYQTYAVTAGQSYTHKYVIAPHTAGQARLATIFMGGPAFNADCWLTVNPATGEKVAQGAGLLRSDVEQLAGGYWSVSVSATAVATNAGAWHSLRVHPLGSSYLSAHTGDGVSGVRCYAVNFTNTSYPVPLTVAQGTAGTVGNHSCSATLSALGITLGAEYSIGLEYTTLTTATDKVVAGLSSGAFADSLYTSPRNPSGSQSFSMISGGAAQFESMSGTAAAVGALQKSALRTKVNDSRAAIAGALTQQDTACVLPVGLTNIRIGGAPWGGSVNDFAGYIHKPWIAPTRALTDTELQSITT